MVGGVPRQGETWDLAAAGPKMLSEFLNALKASTKTPKLVTPHNN